MTLTLIPERLDRIRQIGLSPGGHKPPGDADDAPGACCMLEAVTYCTGLGWSGWPDVFCPAIESYLRDFNDHTTQSARDAVGAWVLANLDRLEVTAKDGSADARRLLLADHAVGVTAEWMDIAGATEQAARVRAMRPIDSRPGADDAVKWARRQLGDVWEVASADLKRTGHAAVTEQIAHGEASVDAAAAAATAAALASIDAVPAAVAHSAAMEGTDPSERPITYGANFAALAVARGAADGMLEALDLWSPWKALFDAVHTQLKARFTELLHEKRVEHGGQPAAEIAVELLEGMLAIGQRPNTTA